VILQAPGTCVVVATAVDGRQSVQTVNVSSSGGGPCGPGLSVDRGQVTFQIPPLADAATSDAGGGDGDGGHDDGGGDL
jgi:hypothetical protein